MTIKNENWLKTNIAWLCDNDLIRDNFAFWSSATSMVTSMSLGNQSGFNTDQSNAPNQPT
tara:strand:- start:10476 stop:10655 length:180 start_codon:yes stop_codon:yes gene_type:complete